MWRLHPGFSESDCRLHPVHIKGPETTFGKSSHCRSYTPGLQTKPASFECKVTVTNKCRSDVLLSFGAAAKKHTSALACKKNAVSTITLKLDALKNLLDCEVSLLKGAKNVVKAKISLHLLELVRVVKGVKHLALDLVEDAKEGVVHVLCGPVLLVKLKL